MGRFAGIRNHEVDIVVFLYGFCHEPGRHVHFRLLDGIPVEVEVARFTVYGLHEYERNAGMCLLHPFDEREKTLSLNGQEEVVVLRTYVSTNNYRIDYDVENFNPVKMGNNSLVLLNNSDNSITIEIENLSAEDYFAEYEKYTNSVDYNAANELDGYTYTYTFLRGNNVYLRVTKCITEDTASLGTLSYRMDYMINSIYIP